MVQHAIKQAAESRAAGRSEEFRRAKTLHEGLTRRSGSSALGRDEEGRPKWTRRHSAFHIVIDRWYVRMGFKKEDQEKLEGRPWLEVEARLKDGDIPRKLVRFDTHIVTAVRVLKHVRQSYQRELAQTDELMAILEPANLILAQRKRGYTEADITSAIAALSAVDSALESKEVAVKKIVARKRISDAIAKLKSAKAMEAGKRDMEVSRACALFVSIRNRLDAWRNKQVAGLVEFNLQKECSMRLERDKWLFSQFSRFAEIPKQVHEYSEKDKAKLEVLDRMRKMLRYRKDSSKVLEYIKENSELFRVARRNNRDAERMIALAESGVQPRVGMNVDYQLGRLRSVYRSILKNDKDRAREHIDSLKLFVKANKPGFILDELGTDPDLYLGSVLEPLTDAISAFESADYLSAEEHFKAARDAIALYAYPQPGVSG